MECDPSIKAIILKIDAEENAFIVEELDEQRLVIKENMVALLKMRLDEVSTGSARAEFLLISSAGAKGDSTRARGLWFRR